MWRLWVASACLVCGVALLAGPGWALLTASGLLFAVKLPVPPWRLWMGWAGRQLLAGWRWLQRGRRQVAIMAMPVGLALIGLGLVQLAGVGYAALVGGVSLAGVALFAGWE